MNFANFYIETAGMMQGGYLYATLAMVLMLLAGQSYHSSSLSNPRSSRGPHCRITNIRSET